MNHEEARGLVEVALHWEGALHLALEEDGLTFMAKADLVRDIQFKLADGSTDLASALLDALEHVEELGAENERLKKVLKSGLVEKMVAAEAGVPSGTEGGRRMAYCRGCGWWLVAEAWEVMEAWGNEKERASEANLASEEGGDG